MDPGRSHSGPKWLVPTAFRASPAEFPGVTPCAQAGLGPHSCHWQALGFVLKGDSDSELLEMEAVGKRLV